jgi:hypothetical protein
MESHKEEFFNTFTMTLAIMNCHGYKELSPPSLIAKQKKDVLVLDYLGLKFKVSHENAMKISNSLLSHFFSRMSYSLDFGDEYDTFPIYKVVEAISSEFKTRTNRLIRPEHRDEAMVKSRVEKNNASFTEHEQYRAMRNDLISCKFLPHIIVSPGIFRPKITESRIPSLRSKSFKIVKSLYDKYYTFSRDDEALGHYITFKNVQVEISGNTITFTELATIHQPYNFMDDGYVRVSKNQVISDLMDTFEDSKLVTLVDLTCNSYDEDPDYEDSFRKPREECEGSEPGEGGGSRRRTAHRKRKSHCKSKRVHHTRKKHTHRHRHSRHRHRHHRR